MKNVVGQPVSGIDYYSRNSITRLIYRRIDAGGSLFMAAPRRVGKTSIMFHLRDEPLEGYIFIYVPSEAINSSELYFKRLFEYLLNSPAIDEKVKASEKSKKIFENISNRIGKISVFGLSVEVDGNKKEKYADIFLELMKKVSHEDLHIVMMIDEFPSTIENINQKHGEVEAVNFLKLNRTIRQESAGGIQFIYTGSIGLPAIVNRLNTAESINDLNQVEIPPLSHEEAIDFADRLLKSADVPYSKNALDYLLEKINWLMPFFIQLSIQELVDLFDQNQKEISKEVVDLAFQNICNRRNNIHFDSYYNRLKDTFNKEDYKIALELLNFIANNNKVNKNKLFSKFNNSNINSIIESLEYDGYIDLTDDFYLFNSPILQLWWNKYISSKI